MTGDVILGLTDAPALRARDWATRRADHLGVELRELLIAPSRDDIDEAVAATVGADILVLPSEHGHPYRGIVAGAHCPVAVIPETDERSESGPVAPVRRGVLVGVDSSEVSEHALVFAAAEAVRAGEPLIALAAWEPVSMGTEPAIDLWTGQLPVDLSDATSTMLDGLLAPVRASYPQLEIERRVEVGDASALLEDASRNVSLTVVGSHGRTGLARLLLGSVSEHVAGHVASPTVIVR